MSGGGPRPVVTCGSGGRAVDHDTPRRTARFIRQVRRRPSTTREARGALDVAGAPPLAGARRRAGRAAARAVGAQAGAVARRRRCHRPRARRSRSRGSPATASPTRTWRFWGYRFPYWVLAMVALPMWVCRPRRARLLRPVGHRQLAHRVLAGGGRGHGPAHHHLRPVVPRQRAGVAWPHRRVLPDAAGLRGARPLRRPEAAAPPPGQGQRAAPRGARRRPGCGVEPHDPPPPCAARRLRGGGCLRARRS